MTTRYQKEREALKAAGVIGEQQDQRKKSPKPTESMLTQLGILLSVEDRKRLKTWADAHGISSESEAVRTIVHDFLKSTEKVTTTEARFKKQDTVICIKDYWIDGVEDNEIAISIGQLCVVKDIDVRYGADFITVETLVSGSLEERYLVDAPVGCFEPLWKRGGRLQVRPFCSKKADN